MIDFRYHIVSLISVFLALAVGIVLGAGPLRDYIADSLSGQVDQLREEKEDLRSELDLASKSLDDTEAFIVGSAVPLISETLPGYTISVIVMPDADPGDVTMAMDTLSQAGASVLNIVEVTEDFTDPTKRAFRSGIAGSVTDYMDPQPSEDASAETILGTAIDQAITSYDPADPQNPSQDASATMDLLRSSDLFTADGEIQPTLLTVVISAGAASPEEARTAELALVKGLDHSRTVVAGIDGEDTLVRLVRDDSDASGLFTTVDSLPRMSGQIILARALAAVIGGEHGGYGFGDNASIFPPNVEISAPEPINPIDEDEATEEVTETDGEES